MDILTFVITLLGTTATLVGAYFTYKAFKYSKTKDKIRLTQFQDEEAFVNEQVHLIESAKFSVLLCIHTANSSLSNWKAEKINNALIKAHKKGLNVCVLTSSGPKQLSGAYELFIENHIALRMTPVLSYSDLRFLIVDTKTSFLGISETDYKNQDYSPSKSWGRIDSQSLSEILNKKFYQLWFDSVSFSFLEYYYQFIHNYVKTISPCSISKEIGIPSDFIVYTLKNKNTIAPKDTIYIFYGKSASGKSSLINLLVNEFSFKELDLIHLVLPYVEKYGNENVTNGLIKEIYCELLEYVETFDFDVIETGSELADFLLPELFKILLKKCKKIKFIYCKSDIKTAIKRNEKRYRPIPNSILVEQDNSERIQFYKQICQSNNIEIVTLDTTQELNVTYSNLKRELHL